MVGLHGGATKFPPIKVGCREEFFCLDPPWVWNHLTCLTAVGQIQQWTRSMQPMKKRAKTGIASFLGVLSNVRAIIWTKLMYVCTSIGTCSSCEGCWDGLCCSRYMFNENLAKKCQYVVLRITHPEESQGCSNGQQRRQSCSQEVADSETMPKIWGYHYPFE